MDPREACSTLLSGLDEDILEYVIGMLEGDEDQETMEAAVAEFLLSCDHCATEDEAVAKCTELFAALKSSALAVEAEVTAAPGLRILDQKVSIAEADAHLFRDTTKDELGGRLVDIDEALDSRKKRKAQQEMELRAVRAAHQRILAQRAAEEAALQNAVTQAVTLRAQNGAYTGAVEAKPFSLPNPGGGRDLLENASFTMVRGRVYGLIGRNGKGKSTLLRALASRMVGNIPAELMVHYVSQEVQMDDEAKLRTPVEMVVHADVERRMLLAEAATLNGENADDEAARRLQEAYACRNACRNAHRYVFRYAHRYVCRNAHRHVCRYTHRYVCRNAHRYIDRYSDRHIDRYADRDARPFVPAAGGNVAAGAHRSSLGRGARDDAADESGLYARAPRAADDGSFGRLARAHRPCCRHLRQAGPAAARRADQPPINR